jgi:hypothetical protein
MSGLSRPPQQAADDETIAAIESALHSLARRLKQARLHDFVLRQAGVDIDQAGLAILYALHAEKASLRVTDLAERLGIDAPAVTRKAQPTTPGPAGSASATGARKRSSVSCSPVMSGSPCCSPTGRPRSGASSLA